MTHFSRACSLLLMVAVACTNERSGSTPREPGHAEFDELFAVQDTIILEEPDSAPITGIRRLAPGLMGGVIVVDRGRPQARIHDSTGALVAIVGRFGGGPGEFREPFDARFDPEGYLYVADSEDITISRFRSDLTYDTAFRAPGLALYEIDWLDHGALLVTSWNSLRAEEPYFQAIVDTAGGSVLSRVGPIDSLVWTIPYWRSFSAPLGAGSSRLIVTGTMLTYPFRLYEPSGGFITEFGTPPASYMAPGEPARGDFTGPGSFDRLSRWLSAMTVVSRLDILQDTLIVAVHARPNPNPSNLYAKTDTTMDIYSPMGTKLWEDVDVPGKVLRAEDLLYVLEAMPPEGPWTVMKYRLRSSNRRR